MSKFVVTDLAFVKSDSAVTSAGQLKTKSAESQKVASANEARVNLVVSNIGSKDVWLGLGAAAVAEKGLYLKKEGGTHNINYFNGEVTAISKEEEPIITFVEV
jgi:uncharacterized protein YlxP (DUF503 family)